MFYVYVYLDPLFPSKCSYDNISFTYVPIYVGKGKGNRYKDHMVKTSNKIFENKIQFWKTNNIKPIVIFIETNISEQDAWDIEERLVVEIGRLDLKTGPLLNLTNGGEGCSGIIPWNKGIQTGSFLTADGQSKISNANKGKVLSDETKSKISVANKGKPKSIVHCKKISESLTGNIPWNKGKHTGQESWMTGKAHSLESRKKMSDSHKGNTLTEEQKTKISNKLKGRVISDETRIKMSESKKQYWAQKKNGT